jgi:transketolase
MAGIIKLLPSLDDQNLNVKIICVTSPQLFALQPVSYRQFVISPADRINSTVISTQSRLAMRSWIFNMAADEYAITPDWDNRWRTGGTVEEVLEEGHLTPNWILDGISRFAKDKNKRLLAFREQLEAAVGS